MLSIRHEDGIIIFQPYDIRSNLWPRKSTDCLFFSPHKGDIKQFLRAAYASSAKRETIINLIAQ